MANFVKKYYFFLFQQSTRFQLFQYLNAKKKKKGYKYSQSNACTHTKKRKYIYMFELAQVQKTAIPNAIEKKKKTSDITQTSSTRVLESEVTLQRNTLLHIRHN